MWREDRNVRVNSAVNPTFRVASGTNTIRTNLCPNPTFRANTSTIELHRNLVPGGFNVDSNADGIADGWTAYNAGGGVGTVTRSLVAGAQRIQASALTGASGDRAGILYTVPPGGVTATGVPCQMSVDLKGSVPAGRNVRVYVDFRDAVPAITLNQTLVIPAASITSSFQTFTFNGSTVLPAATTAAYVYVWVEGGGGGAAAAADLYVDNLIVEASNVAAPFFDGASANGSFGFNMSSVWSGTANASSSIAQGQRPAMWSQATTNLNIWQAEDGASLYFRNYTNATLGGAATVAYVASALPYAGQVISLSARSYGPAQGMVYAQGYGGSASASSFSPAEGSGGVTAINGQTLGTSTSMRPVLRTPTGLAVGAWGRFSEVVYEMRTIAGEFFDGESVSAVPNLYKGNYTTSVLTVAPRADGSTVISGDLIAGRWVLFRSVGSAPGDYLSGSIEISGPVGDVAYLYTTDSVIGAWSWSVPNVTLQGEGNWIRVDFTASKALPAGATSTASLGIGIAGGVKKTGDWLVRKIDMGKVPALSIPLGAYREQNVSMIASTPGVSTSWAGVQHQSSSIMTGPKVANAAFNDYGTNSNIISWQGPGQNSLLVQALNAPGNGLALFSASSPVPTTNVGDYFSIRYQARAVRATTDTTIVSRLAAYKSNSNAFDVNWFSGSNPSAVIPKSGEWVDIVAPSVNPSTSTTDTAQVRPYFTFGGAQADDIYEFRNVVLEKVPNPGSVAGSYFDGSTPNVANGLSYRWAGAIDLSFSQAYLTQMIAPPTGVNTDFNQMSEHWLIDGYDLTNFAFNITKATLTVPELRGEHTVLPQRSGILPRYNRAYDAGEIALSMWVIGAEQDGSVPQFRSEKRALFERNLEALLTLFQHQSGYVTLYKQCVVPGGDGTLETRWARALVTGSTSVETMAARQRAEMTVTLKTIDAHWSVSNSTVESSTPSAVLPQTVSLTRMGSAPVDDAIISITGPVTNPTITCPDSGSSVTYTGTVSAGQVLVLDSGLWKATIGATDVSTAVTNLGHARWAYIPPRGSAVVDATASFQPRVVLSGTGASAATKFTVSYKKRYLLP